ncbi:mucin-22-like isoform X2 [Cherax quadricarinatus]|nr:serine-rich adhesin for platelets-like isoform X2 [Cherax quadricarinatus]
MVGIGGEERASRWLLELLRHQEELIAQLEKENDFLKREVVSVGEGVKMMGQENQELNRRLADALTQAITMGECSDTSSISSSERNSGDKDATNSTIAALTREKAALQEQVSHLDASLSAVTLKEQEALTKLRQALTLAQDTHSHTVQVRASSETALEELSALLTATKQEGQELRKRLDEADSRHKRQQEQKEEHVGQLLQRVKALQEEREQQDEVMTRLRQEVRESSRKVAALEEDLQAARAARTRLEVQLEEQRQHSKDAHSRLEHIVLTRSGEAAAGTARAQELEERLTAAREDTSRLLHAITSLAQGSGRGVEADTTDDVKSERLAAGQQLSAAITALQTRHECEVRSLREAASQQSEAMDRLREEVSNMRQQLADDSNSYRNRLEEVGRCLATLASTATAAVASQPYQDSFQPRKHTSEGGNEPPLSTLAVPGDATTPATNDSTAVNINAPAANCTTVTSISNTPAADSNTTATGRNSAATASNTSATNRNITTPATDTTTAVNINAITANYTTATNINNTSATDSNTTAASGRNTTATDSNTTATNSNTTATNNNTTTIDSNTPAGSNTIAADSKTTVDVSNTTATNIKVTPGTDSTTTAVTNTLGVGNGATAADNNTVTADSKTAVENSNISATNIKATPASTNNTPATDSTTTTTINTPATENNTATADSNTAATDTANTTTPTTEINTVAFNNSTTVIDSNIIPVVPTSIDATDITTTPILPTTSATESNVLNTTTIAPITHTNIDIKPEDTNDQQELINGQHESLEWKQVDSEFSHGEPISSSMRVENQDVENRQAKAKSKNGKVEDKTEENKMGDSNKEAMVTDKEPVNTMGDTNCIEAEVDKKMEINREKNSEEKAKRNDDEDTSANEVKSLTESSKNKEDEGGLGLRDVEDTPDSETDDTKGESDGEEKGKTVCDKCETLMMILEVLGGAVEGLQKDVEKQGWRLGRLIQHHSSQCENCLKYQFVLMTTFTRLDCVDKYTHLLGDRIDALSRRVLSI